MRLVIVVVDASVGIVGGVVIIDVFSFKPIGRSSIRWVGDGGMGSIQ